jgi:hypothetical protein
MANLPTLDNKIANNTTPGKRNKSTAKKTKETGVLPRVAAVATQK